MNLEVYDGIANYSIPSSSYNAPSLSWDYSQNKEYFESNYKYKTTAIDDSNYKVEIVDIKEPEVRNGEAIYTTTNSIVMQFEARDTGDGVDKYRVHYRNTNKADSETPIEVDWQESEGGTEEFVGTKYVLRGLKENVQYEIYIEVLDKEGNSCKTNTFTPTTKAKANVTEVNGVSLNKNSTTIKVGNTETLTATVSPSDATCKYVTWTTSDKTIATVDENGKVTGIKKGSATIKVETADGDYTATCDVTISEDEDPTVEVTGVSLNKQETTIKVGNLERLIATIEPNNATNKNVTWSSSNKTIATVDSNGVVTGVKKGKAKITATTEDGNHTATCNVTIEEAPPTTISVTGVSLNKNETTIEKGKTETLVATVTPENATNKKVTWTSNQEEIATVDSNGVVTGVKKGTAKITVTTEDGNHTETCNVTVNETEKIVEKIEIKTNPDKTTYIKGEDISLTGGKITITYNDNSTEDIDIENNMITGYNANLLGEQIITVTYKGKTTTFKVTVTNNVTSLTIKTLPTTKKYLKGQEIDLTGGKIKVVYENGDNEEIEMKSTDVTVTGYDPNKIGEQTVTITYKGESATFNVTVVEENEVTEITVVSKPKRTVYIKGENLNLIGGKIKVKYLDKTTAEINMTEEMITEYDKNVVGEQEVKVTYGKATTTFDVTVKNGVSKIVIDSKPTTLTYIKGKADELDLTGGKIAVTYDDNSTETIDMESSMIDGYNKNTVGMQTITVKYGDKTDEFEITVKNDITDIVISSVPDKLTYEKGNELDLTGGKIKVIYENGETEEIDMNSADISITGFDSNKVGEQTVTINYKGKTNTFKVTVKAESSNNDNNNNNNNNSNGNNSGNNNNNSNSNQQPATKNDNTTANVILPKTGIGKIMLGIIVLLTVGGVTYIRFRKLKDVK